MTPRLFRVFVPAYNEEDAIFPMADQFDLLEKKLKIRGIQLEVTFIDDGSRDKTAQRVEKAGVKRPYLHLVRHPQNRGLVGVLETVLDLANRKNRGVCLGIGLLDGDGSHPPQVFEPMILKLLEGYGVVIASRFQKGSSIEGLSLHRQFTSWVVSMLFRALGGLKNVRDYSCGFRAYNPKILAPLKSYRFQSRSFACMTELLLCCNRPGVQFAEIPFHLAYDLKKGPSKMPFLRTVTESLKLLVQTRNFGVKE
jgi:dolichol-phosphate mannosyltransferase